MPWMKIKAAALHASVSPRTLRGWLKAGLQHSRVGGSILVNTGDLDEYIRRHVVTTNLVDEIVAETLSAGKGKRR
jgi:hypothetical protein